MLHQYDNFAVINAVVIIIILTIVIIQTLVGLPNV